MNILIRNSDNVVIYAEPCTLDEECARGADWVDFNFTAANARLEDAELPENWVGAVWAYEDGEWSVFDTPRHDQILAAAAYQHAPVPSEVTRRQGLQELRIRGITEEMIETKINENIADPLARDLALIELRTSQVFERFRPLTLTMGAVFGLNLNEVFIAAAKL